MRDTVIITATSTASGRTAVVDAALDSIWLYLSRPGEMRPEIACWVLNTRGAPRVPDFAVYRQQSSPPPLPLAHLAATTPDPFDGHWSLLWSRDGNAVSTMLDELPIAFVVSGRSRGYARYVTSGADAWALPWDEDLFTAIFADV